MAFSLTEHTSVPRNRRAFDGRVSKASAEFAFRFARVLDGRV
jgi:hypothetical protein